MTSRAVNVGNIFKRSAVANINADDIDKVINVCVLPRRQKYSCMSLYIKVDVGTCCYSCADIYAFECYNKTRSKSCLYSTYLSKRYMGGFFIPQIFYKF